MLSIPLPPVAEPVGLFLAIPSSSPVKLIGRDANMDVALSSDACFVQRLKFGCVGGRERGEALAGLIVLTAEKGRSALGLYRRSRSYLHPGPYSVIHPVEVAPRGDRVTLLLHGKYLRHPLPSSPRRLLPEPTVALMLNALPGGAILAVPMPMAAARASAA